MIFDDNKKLIGFDDKNIYHSFNKNNHLLPYSEQFLNKNVILMGDSMQVSFFILFNKKTMYLILKDKSMTEKLKLGNQLSICFLNYPVFY